MFERARIGGALYDLCDLAARQGVPLSKRVIHDWADDLIAGAVNNMKRLKLKPDQAAVGLVINLVNSLHECGLLEKAREEQYDRFLCLIRVYHGACQLVFERPDYFRWAKAFFDDEVFEATNPIRLSASR